MSFEGLEHVADVTVGSWITPRLRGFGGLVHCVVPDGFPAYARILHPASDDEGSPVPWAEVCRRTGRREHALMQWNGIAGGTRHVPTEGRWPRRYEVSHPTLQWSGNEPQTGELAPGALAEVLEVLADFTEEGADCFLALWVGWGWLHEGAWGFLTAGDDGTRVPVPLASAGLPPEIVDAPQLELPGRDYLLFRGPLRGALRMGHQVTEEWFHPQSPSLLWPADHAWCLATEVDFDSTLVGGPQELIDALLAAPGLEVWQVQPTDDLTYDGDTVNR